MGPITLILAGLVVLSWGAMAALLLMQRGHIPAEHDIAEYLEAVLIGPKERVEEVVRSRFPLPTAIFSSGPVPVAVPMDAAPTLHGRAMPPAPLPPPPSSALERPRLDSRTGGGSKNLPGWALVLVLAAIVGVALVAWYLFPAR